MASKRQTTPESAHLFDYIRVVVKRLWFIVGIFILVVGIVGFATYRATPMFRATAVLNIRQPTVLPGGIDPTAILTAASNSQVYLNTQYELLSSRKTVETMVDRQNLAGDDAFKGQSKEQIIRSITGNITVTPQRGTSLVAVTVVDSRKSIVHRIANELVATFIEEQAKAQESSLQDTIDRLETKAMEYDGKAQFGNNQINRLFEEHNTDRETFLEKLDFARQRIQEKQSLIDGEELELARRRPFYDKIAAALAEGDPQGGALQALYEQPMVRRDRTVRDLQENIRQLDRNIKALVDEEKLGPTNAAVLALERQRANQLSRLEYEKREFLMSYYTDYQLSLETKEILVRQLEEDEQEFRSLSSMKLEYDDAMDNIERDKAEAQRYDALYDKLISRRNEGFAPATIAQPAEQPFLPFKPNKEMNILLGAIFGLLGGIGAAFFLEYLDDTIKTKDELQRITDAPLLGVIPNISAKRNDVAKRDLFAYNQPKSTISEAFRGVRTAISYSTGGRESRTFIVTSSGPKEGKTTVAINISTVMAYSGARTLLIDADLRKPRVHKSFELNNSRGLSNLIIGDAPAEELIQPTGLDRLDVLCSGPIPPNPSELLGGPRMLQILDELKEKYDRILIDTPPIGAVTDAAVVGQIVDSVLLVVHAGKTRRKLIERGLEQLAQINVAVGGIILNNLRIGQKRYYPGYDHYYYYYSSYYGADSKQKGRSRDKSKT